MLQPPIPMSVFLISIVNYWSKQKVSLDFSHGQIFWGGGEWWVVCTPVECFAPPQKVSHPLRKFPTTPRENCTPPLQYDWNKDFDQHSRTKSENLSLVWFFIHLTSHLHYYSAIWIIIYYRCKRDRDRKAVERRTENFGKHCRKERWYFTLFRRRKYLRSWSK